MVMHTAAPNRLHACAPYRKRETERREIRHRRSRVAEPKVGGVGRPSVRIGKCASVSAIGHAVDVRCGAPVGCRRCQLGSIDDSARGLRMGWWGGGESTCGIQGQS